MILIFILINQQNHLSFKIYITQLQNLLIILHQIIIHYTYLIFHLFHHKLNNYILLLIPTLLKFLSF